MPGTEPVLLLWMLNLNAMFYRDIYFQAGKLKISDTVEPRLTATLVIKPHRHHSHFFFDLTIGKRAIHYLILLFKFHTLYEF